jgi:hypothetical protein
VRIAIRWFRHAAPIAAGLIVVACSGTLQESDANPTSPAVSAAATTLETSIVPAYVAPTIATTAAVASEPAPVAEPADELLLVDGTDPEAASGWRVINDGVMGGVSASTVTDSAHGIVFAGTVSLDNNGGFASIRKTFDAVADLSGFTSLVVEAIGDGKTYVIELRTDMDDVSYWQRFVPTAGATVVDLPLAGFTPHSRFGEPIAAGPVFDPAQVGSVAVYILDKQVGEFRVVIRRIAAR